MTVEQLVEILYTMPQDAQVAISEEMAEAQGMVSSVKLLDKENAPYDKGDDIWYLGIAKPDEKVVFILTQP